MVKLQLLKDNKIIVCDNALKVFNNNNNLTFVIQTKNVEVIEKDNCVEVLTEEKPIKWEESPEVYEVKLTNIYSGKFYAIRAVKVLFNLSLKDAKNLCENDSSVVYSTKNKEEAVEIWSKLKEELKDTNIKVILDEYV